MGGGLAGVVAVGEGLGGVVSSSWRVFDAVADSISRSGDAFPLPIELLLSVRALSL